MVAGRFMQPRRNDSGHIGFVDRHLHIAVLNEGNLVIAQTRSGEGADHVEPPLVEKERVEIAIGAHDGIPSSAPKGLPLPWG